MALRIVLLTTLTTLRLLACNAQAVTSSNYSTPAGPSSWTPLVANGPSLNVWVRNDSILSPAGTVWSSQGHDDLSSSAAVWSSFIRVDGRTFQWLGQAGLYEGPTTTEVTTSSSSTIIRQTFPSISLVTRFLTPPPPASPDLRFSYVVSQVTSTDGAGHDVQMLSIVASPTTVKIKDSADQTFELWETGGKAVQWAARTRTEDTTSGARSTIAAFSSSANASVLSTWADSGAMPVSSSSEGGSFAVMSFDLGQISTTYARKEQEAAMVFVSTASSGPHSSRGVMDSYTAVASATDRFDRQAESDAQAYAGPNAEAVGQLVRGYKRSLAMLDEDAQPAALLVNSPLLVYSSPDRLRAIADGVLARNTANETVDDAASTILFSCIAHNSTEHSLGSDAYVSLKRRADDLLQNDRGLYPPALRSLGDLADGVAASSNLAVKAVIAIKAMARLASRAKHDDDASHFEIAAADLATRFMTDYVIVNDTNRHVVLSRGNSSSWSSLPNLLYDRLLGLNTFPATFYSQQQDFLRTIIGPHGVPLDSRSQLANAYQQSQLAAIFPNLRDVLMLSGPYYSLAGPYDAWHGTFDPLLGGPKSAPIGALFTLLAMPEIDPNAPAYDLAGQMADSPQSEADNPFYSMRAAWAALLAAICIIVALGAFAALWTWVARRRSQRRNKKEEGGSEPKYAKVDEVVPGVVGEQAAKEQV